jgi:cytoskeletal protein CcmA (bactofilin family)
MALWKDSSQSANPVPVSPDAVPTTRSSTAPGGAGGGPTGLKGDAGSRPRERADLKESVISAGLTIEGKITGSGHVRVGGKFKGDVQVEGNVHIDSGARVEGQVRATEILISGELLGNIEGARRVELQQGGTITGDVKAGWLTVAAGSRMRGQVEFGWEESGKAATTDIKGHSSAA